MHLVSEHTPFRAELSASFSKSFFFFQGRQWKDKPRSLCNNSKPLSKYMSHTSWAMSWEPGVSRNEEQLFCSVFLITQLQTSAKILLQREDWKQSKGLQIVIQGWIRGNDLRVKSLKVALSKGKYQRLFIPAVLQNWGVFLILVRRETYYRLFMPGWLEDRLTQ